MKPEEALWLRHWTAKAVQCMFTIWHNADEASFSATTSASIAYALQTVSRILKEATREGIPVHPLCRLPRQVLCNIWSHLTLADALAISRASRSLSDVVLFSPELWTDLLGPDGEPKPLHQPRLAAYVWRSAAEPLRIGLLCTAGMFVQLAPTLAYAMPRVTILHLDCCDIPEASAPPGALRGSRTWAWELQWLTVPAPRLVSLQLRHVEGTLSGYNPLGHDCIPIDYPLFSGMAPCLRRCRLSAVLLPPPAHCGAFKDVTTFSYRLHGDISPCVIAQVLETMPRLEVLELEGAGIACEPPAAVGGPERPPPVEPRHASLRVLMCSFLTLKISEQLAPLIPLAQLQELWLSVDFASALNGMELLQPGTAGMYLSLNYLDGMAGSLHPAADAQTPTVFFEILWPRRRPDLLAPFACITWLSVQEYLLNNIAGGALPAAPALTVLCVRLAGPSEHADRSGFLVGNDEHPPWALPALREVRIGAAGESAPVSITLHDVARWIRRALMFGEQSLDTVVLSGVWVADLDFCAAWAALSEHTASIRLDEEADPRYFASDEDMSYYRRSTSLFAA